MQPNTCDRISRILVNTRGQDVPTAALWAKAHEPIFYSTCVEEKITGETLIRILRRLD